jgi:hypothetical protein
MSVGMAVAMTVMVVVAAHDVVQAGSRVEPYWLFALEWGSISSRRSRDGFEARRIPSFIHPRFLAASAAGA